jgi:hypothetical protein
VEGELEGDFVFFVLVSVGCMVGTGAGAGAGADG